MSSVPLDAADLLQALEGRFPYHLLSVSLQQRLTPQEYLARTQQYCILRWYAYHRLPDFLKASTSESEYYESMVRCAGEQLQLYPYVHQKQILFYTRETSLTYYVRMIAELLKSERSYDRLPNFTAVDILQLLGIGRNQYLNTTKEVRSKLRWHVNRNFVPEHLPSELLPTVQLDPFWVVLPAVEPSALQPQDMERVTRLCQETPEDAVLYRLLATKGTSATVSPSTGGGNNSFVDTVVRTGSSVFSPSSSLRKASEARQQQLEALLQVERQAFTSDVVYACQLPYESVHRLYRRALVCADFSVSPDDYVVVPPLGQFVMNRTSDEPLELLLYRVLSTLDDRTPLQLLAQLLMVAEDDVCAAVHALIRLGLARKKYVELPESIERGPARVHPTWRTVVESLLLEKSGSPRQVQVSGPSTEPRLPSSSSPPQHLQLRTDSSSERARATGVEDELVHESSSVALDASDSALVRAASRHGEIASAGPSSSLAQEKRIALLYDATLTGFLMMTNLNRDPTFKQLAVTLFEVGKMPDELVGSFLELLERIDPEEARTFGGEAQKYMNSAVSLREVLKVLKRVRGPDGATGVDLLKIESLNELEATTRYSVLGRNYWAYITTAPIATTPLIDIELSCVYGNTASLTASPWLLLFLYERMHRGPPTVLLPFGSQMHSWPPAFIDVEDVAPARGEMSGEQDEGCSAKVRARAVTLDAEVMYTDLDSSLLLVNEMAVTAPVFAQCVAPIPLEAAAEARRGGSGRAEQTGFRWVEVTLPFTATRQNTHDLLVREITKDIAYFSSAAAEAGSSAYFEDDAEELYKLLSQCVDALRLHDSLGYLTFCVTFHAVKGNAQCAATSPAVSTAESAGVACSDALLAFSLDHVDVVDIGFGVSLTRAECCACALEELPRLLSDEASERHNAAMRQCVKDFSAFLEHHSTLTRAVYGKLALLSAAATGPMTQMHLRKVGGSGGAVPFPSTTLVFDGEELRTVDDTNPLSEQW